jgi:general nucleoside transport system ATP-binding protein
MSEGRIVYETSAADARREVLGAHMGGSHHDEELSLRARPAIHV